ncbi:Adenosine kinase [Oligella sp. MSHR50489EDL]|uniref:carbohydrate kinase family protein n=1 Tax=Oligella sp. MSHR50489EDL TaxID=3139409 RepID=UPI003D81A02A
MSEQSKEVLICGSLAFDTITRFDGYFKDHILADTIHSLSVSFLVPTMRKEFGGCAGNIAYNLHLLGGAPVPVAAVGRDFGDYQQHFEKLGIKQRRIAVLEDVFTAQCHITTDLSGNQISAFHPGAMSFAADNDISQEQAVWAIVAPDAKDAMFKHAERLHAAAIPFIFDLGQAMPLFDGNDLEAMIKLARVLTANDYEMAVIEQRTAKSVEELAKGLEAIIVTLGAEGSVLYHQGEKIAIKPVAPTAIEDPTGCGDAHRAGVLYGLSCDWSWLDSARLGNVMGSIKIASGGPQNHQPSLEEIQRLFIENYGNNPWQ